MKPNRHDTERQKARAEDALFEAIISLESAAESILEAFGGLDFGDRERFAI